MNALAASLVQEASGSNYKPRFEDILKKVLKCFEKIFEKKMKSEKVPKLLQNFFKTGGTIINPLIPFTFLPELPTL
jgi:hypothetical protein